MEEKNEQLKEEQLKEELPKEEHPKEEHPKEEQLKVETPKQRTLQETIECIKQGYETKLAEQKAEADKAIKERDEVIKQLLSGNGTANEPPSIVDKINAKRNYKKW